MAYLSKRAGEEIDALLDKVERGDFDIEVDTELSKTSPNAIANSAVAKALNNKVDKIAGKGLSTNDYTNEEKEKVKYANDTIPRIERETESNTQSIEKIKENAVKSDDYYPKMSVGFADNLIGRGEATAEEFTYRASAGMERSITDDTARVKKIKGNSVVWNQRCNHQLYSGSQTKNGVTLTSNGDGSFSIETDANGATELTSFNVSSLEITGLSGHKILIAGAPIGSSRSTYYLIDNFTGNYCFDSVIFTKISASGKGDCYIEVVKGCVITKPVIFKPQYIDLTQMFGAGNEPSTIEEFYARIPSGIDVNAYNEGEIINLNTEAIKTVGFNQWDEQWKVGYYDINSGNWIYSNNVICSVNPIPVISGAEYYAHFGYSNYAWGVFYDKNAQVIGAKTITKKIFTVPTGAMYMHFYTNQERDNNLNAVYHNDICINLSHTGTENGKYKPYTPFTRELPIIKNYFPNGMRSAGTAFDSIEWDSSKQKWVAVQRIGEVDLGSLSWRLDHTSFISGNLPVLGAEPIKWSTPTNSLCSKYQIASQSQLFDDQMDKTIASWGSIIRLLDTSYTEVSELKSALQGVMFYYELAEPIVPEIEEENISFDYYVEDFGTEEALSSVPSAPFRADVVYTFNAVDTIRNNYLAIEEMKKQMAQMQNAISAIQTAQAKEEE